MKQGSSIWGVEPRVVSATVCTRKTGGRRVLSNFSKMIAKIKIVFSIAIIYLEIEEKTSPVSRWKLFIFKYIKRLHLLN